MAGSAGGLSDVSGSYWTETAAFPGACYSLPVTPDRAGAVATQIPESGFSVRCVRAREGQAIPCFFPLCGWAGGLTDVSGTYWTCTGFVNPGYGYRLSLSAGSAGPVSHVAMPNGYSVRCVRAREEQAIPLFWIVWFWSSLNVLRDWPESEASSWVSWSVSGLFSNPPEAELFPVIFRRFPRRNRSATGCVSPCLPAFQRLLFFFPLAGWSVGLSDVSGTYWATGDEDKWHNRFVLQASAGSCVVGWVQPDQFVSLRCVRAREEQAVPCFFPLSGTAGAPAEVSGTYLSTTPAAYGFVYRVAVTASSAAVVGNTPSTGYASSVRCVRAREEQAIPCFFPLAGWDGGPSAVSGFYWSCTRDYPGSLNSQRLTVLPSSAAVAGYALATAASVRCVRAREEQAIPLFWIVWFWVL